MHYVTKVGLNYKNKVNAQSIQSPIQEAQLNFLAKAWPNLTIEYLVLGPNKIARKKKLDTDVAK